MSKETSKAVVVAAQQQVDRPPIEFSEEEIAILRGQIAQGATPEELGFFLQVCKRMNLDPFRKEIHFSKVWSSQEQRKVLVTMVGIDGFRGMAETTGEYVGQRGPWWCGEDGEWKEVWLGKDAPHAAKIQILRKSFPEPITAVATFLSYCQYDKDHKPKGLWKTMPDNQLAKCAEALGFRRAFPRKFSGIYIPEEMDQAANDMPPEMVAQEKQEKAAKALTSATTNVPADTVQLIREAAHKVGATQEAANEFIEKLSAKWPTLDEKGRKQAVEDILGPWRERYKEIQQERKAKANERKTAGAPKTAPVEQLKPQPEPAPQQPAAPPSDHVMRWSPWRANRPDADPANFGAASKAVATQGAEPKSAAEFVDGIADDDDGWSKTQQFLGREPGDEPPEEFEEEPF